MPPDPGSFSPRSGKLRGEGGRAAPPPSAGRDVRERAAGWTRQVPGTCSLRGARTRQVSGTRGLRAPERAKSRERGGREAERRAPPGGPPAAGNLGERAPGSGEFLAKI